jgi:hypothetical protein
MTKIARRVRNSRFKKILIVLVAIVGFPFAIIMLLASLSEARR